MKSLLAVWMVVVGVGVQTLTSSPTYAQPAAEAQAQAPESKIDPLRLVLRKDMVVRLPEVPAKEEHLALWKQLSPAEQQRFYVRRLLLLQRLAAGLSRPGFSSGMIWVKDKMAAFGRFIKNRLSAAETLAAPADAPTPTLDAAAQDGTPELQETESLREVLMEIVPENISPRGREMIVTNITAFSDSLWAKSPEIVHATGIGMTFVGAAIFNVSATRFGYVYGRGYSLDIGLNFADGSGYLRILYDRQSLLKGGMSFDVGPMFDAFLHLISEPEAGFQKGHHIEATHVKLPIVGCFRFGPEYFAIGGQFGISVVEIAGAWAMSHGYYWIGSQMIGAFRVLGFLMTYASVLDREIVTKTYRPWPQLIRKLGLSKLLPRESDYQWVAKQTATVDCEQALEAAPSVPPPAHSAAAN